MPKRVRKKPASKKTRPRCKLPSQLADVLTKYMTRPNFFVYAEEKGPLRKDLLVPHKGMFVELAGISNTLVFGKVALERALLLCFAAKSSQPGFSFKQGEEKKWAQSVGSRLRVACRALQQNRIKASPPQWLRLMSLPAYSTSDAVVAPEDDECDADEGDEGGEAGEEESPVFSAEEADIEPGLGEVPGRSEKVKFT